MKFLKPVYCLSLMLLSATGIFAQELPEQEKYTPPENPEKIWQEFMETKPPNYEIVGLVRYGEEPFQSWAVREALARKLQKKELLPLMKWGGLNPMLFEGSWHKLEAVAECGDWLDFAEDLYVYSESAKKKIIVKIDGCELKDVNAQKLKCYFSACRKNTS